MSSDRIGPQARKPLHTWRYYNDHFNVERLNELPHYSQVSRPPPNVYRHPQYPFQQYDVKKPARLNKYDDPTGSNSTPAQSNKWKRFYDQIVEGFDHYCDTSTLHGLKYVGENRFSKAERIFWFIAFLVAVCMAVFFINQLFENYHDSPVIVGFSPDVVNVQEIPFPAVTICNNNVAFKSRAEKIKKSGTTLEKVLLDDVCNTNTTHVDMDITWRAMEGLILNVTQRCREMIVYCMWQGKKRRCAELINSVMSDDGYCCTFNKLPLSYVRKGETEEEINSMFPPNIVDWTPEGGYPQDASNDTYPYRAFGRGVLHGLTLVLNAALDEYYCSTTNSFGFKALFHTPRESPKIADLGFLIHPGVEMRIAIDTEIEQASDSISGMDYRMRKCFYADEKPLRFYKLYSTRNCLLECEANYTFAKCECTPYFLPREVGTKICDKSDQACASEASYVINRFGVEKSACECLPACAQFFYYPGIESQAKLMDLNDIISSELLGNHSREYFAENMAIVHIFYQSDRFQVQIKTAMYTFTGFLSNTGGLLGLFLGFSFLSVVEILYFLFVRGACVWAQNRRNKTQKRKIFLQ